MSGLAGYAASVVATSDQTGYYESEFTFIPGDEMVTVWAEKEGYSLDPQQYYWRHYFGREERTLDFIARPVMTNCPPPLPVPNRILVNRGSWNTDKLTYPLTLYLGQGSASPTATVVITVTSVAGTITRTGSLATGMPITMTLRPNTVHMPTVYGRFEHTAECNYVTSTQYDDTGFPLIITQGMPYRIDLAPIFR